MLREEKVVDQSVEEKREFQKQSSRSAAEIRDEQRLSDDQQSASLLTDLRALSWVVQRPLRNSADETTAIVT